MAKKDYKDEYFESLDRLSRLKRNGDISEEEYINEKSSLDRKKRAHENPILNIIVSILLLLMIGYILFLFANKSSDSEPAPDLSVNVERSLRGVIVQNNEPDTLTGCEMTLNGKYSSKVKAIDDQERTYPYEIFTDKDGVRFNILTMQPESLSISNCKENRDRFAAYTW